METNVSCISLVCQTFKFPSLNPHQHTVSLPLYHPILKMEKQASERSRQVSNPKSHISRCRADPEPTRTQPQAHVCFSPSHKLPAVCQFEVSSSHLAAAAIFLKSGDSKMTGSFHSSSDREYYIPRAGNSVAKEWCCLKNPLWDSERKHRPTGASLNATCVSQMLTRLSEPQTTKVILVTTVNSLDASSRKRGRTSKGSR